VHSASKVWRITWTVATFVVVETAVFGLAAAPVVFLWLWLIRVVEAGRALEIIGFAIAILPSYALFAMMLMIVSPLVTRLTGWRTPRDTEMRIADLDWPLLDWIRYMASNHLVRVMVGTVFRGSPLWTFYLRLAGAQIGKRVYINSLSLNDYNLLEFGDDVVIGSDVHLSGHTVECGVVKTAGVKVCRNTTVGLGSIIEIGVEVEANCEVAALTFVPKRTRLEEGALYAGIPARRIR
jgi:carbonic anhydrase/acetyltransferase-like protein (isoleucine patch superfamily)